MKSFQEKKKWSNLAQSKPVLAILATLLFFFAWSVFGFWGKMTDTRDNKKIVEDKVNELEEKKVILETDIEKLQTEKGIEENIREKFGWAKEGEKVIIIVEDKNEVNTENEKQSGGFFFFFKNLFK